jgi:hypothetical protein
MRPARELLAASSVRLRPSVLERIRHAAQARGVTPREEMRAGLEKLYGEGMAQGSVPAHLEARRARGSQPVRFHLAIEEMRRADAYAARLGLKRAVAIAELVLHGLDAVEQRAGIPASRVDDVLAVLESLEGLLGAMGPASLGTQRLLAYWVAKAGGGKVSEEDLLDESRAAGQDEWEQVYDRVQPPGRAGE